MAKTSKSKSNVTDENPLAHAAEVIGSALGSLVRKAGFSAPATKKKIDKKPAVAVKKAVSKKAVSKKTVAKKVPAASTKKSTPKKVSKKKTK